MASTLHAPSGSPFVRGRRTYLSAPRSLHFPSEERLDEAVPETKRHLEARTTLYLLLKDALASAAIGSDQFVYWDASDPKRCLAPDVFVKLGVRDDTFDNWKTWERSAPDLAVEIVSATDRSEADWAEKFERYRASGITELVRFDPASERRPIRVWDRLDEDLVERSRDAGDGENADVHECAALGLWWVIVDSDHGPMLRLARDRDGGRLLPTPAEDRLRLADELVNERRARTIAEHERMIAEHERMIAEQERTRAEQERTRAEEARARAENERTRAEEARIAAERESAVAERRLREESEARERERAEAAAEIERLKEELARARLNGPERS